MDPISLLIWLLVLAVAVGVGVWIVRKTVPPAYQWIGLLAVGVIALVVLVQLVSALGLIDGGVPELDVD